MAQPQLLPYPRSLKPGHGYFLLPEQCVLLLPEELRREGVMLPLANRLKEAAEEAGVELELATGPATHPRCAIAAIRGGKAPAQGEGYRLEINAKGIQIEYRDGPGLRAATATLRQLIQQFGRKLPRLDISDYPDFARRGVMLDISRGRVPNLHTLLGLVDQLADWKINELQLYTEHTFAYRNYEAVWGRWGAVSGEEILVLDARCRELGIDLVPNQNSFGHLRYWLEHPPLRHLAEVSEPYEGTGGTFLRYPSTLAPLNRGTLPFLRSLYDELLPHFSSTFFNVGCDETWDLGRGQSARRCAEIGKGRVYLDFLKRVHLEVTKRGKKMMFWGDIILNHPELMRDVPNDVTALNWGYEANHPFEEETALFGESGMQFYVCPGTSTWMTLVGRHDNALANLESAARYGLKNGAIGYLNTDWGDGGHPQPIAVSYLPYLAGASLSWCRSSHREELLIPVLNRDVFHDPSGRTASAALAMGMAHRKFDYIQPNITPFGSVIAAPLPRTRELMNRDGLKLYARIKRKRILAALEDLEAQRALLYKSTPTSHSGEILAVELDQAARMAAESCHIMLWQQDLATGKTRQAARASRKAIKRLRDLEHDVRAYWQFRNKGDARMCCPWIRWRIEDYREARLHFRPDETAVHPRSYVAE